MMRLMAGASYELGAILLHVFFHLLVIHFADKLNRGSENVAWQEAPQSGRRWAPKSLSLPPRVKLDNEHGLFLYFFFSLELLAAPLGTWQWQGQELLLGCLKAIKRCSQHFLGTVQ